MTDRQRAKVVRRRVRLEKKRDRSLERRDSRRRESAELEDFVDAEFFDPERIGERLVRFRELALVEPALAAALLAPSEIVFALHDLPPSGEADAPFIARALVVAATREFVQRARDAVFRFFNEGDFDEEEDELAVMTGGAFLDAILVDGASVETNAATNALFAASFERAFLGGSILAGVVLPSLEADAEAARKEFAQALARSELAMDLGSIGVVARDPAVLAARYSVRPEPPLALAPIHVDGILHGVLANVELFERCGQELLERGLTPELRTRMRAAFERAYRADVSPELVAEVRRRSIVRELAFVDSQENADPETADQANADEASASPESATRDDPEHERERVRVAIASLDAVPPEENVHLRALYLQSLTAARFCIGESWPFVERLCEAPDDLWALEEYERYLVSRGEDERARRVIRFARTVRLSGNGSSSPAA